MHTRSVTLVQVCICELEGFYGVFESEMCRFVILSHSDHVLYASRVWIGHQTHSFIRCLQRASQCFSRQTHSSLKPLGENTVKHTHTSALWVAFLLWKKSLFPVRAYPLKCAVDYVRLLWVNSWCIGRIFIFNIQGLHLTPQNCC